MVIELEVREEVALVRINRPEAKNSLTLGQIGELRTAVDGAAASDARCLLLTGASACFCAGRDLKEADPDSEDTYRIMADLINPLLVAVRNFPVPTIAAVQGPALGLGLGLALGCDIVLAAENAVFGSPFRNFGGVTDSGGHYFLSERIGPHRAAELIFTGRLISGRDAASLGLINHAVPAPQLPGQSWKWCRDIASGPTAAFKASKRILAVPRGFEATLEMEARAMDAALKSADGREGMNAFKSKRAPRFIGQ
jgi:2-(1,2-epoxy-1,2-dihydrophenyl)acetyl-CoA isomerase